MSAENERERRLRELERENAVLKAAIRACPAGILIATAPDGVIEHWNPAALGIRGGGDELTQVPLEHHPLKWETFHPNGDRFEAEELPLARALLHGEVSDGVDVIIRNEDGTQRWVAGHAAPVRGPDGEIVAGVVVFPDITERRNAELATERFRAMAELSPDFVGMATPDGRTVYINAAARQLCGIPEDVDCGELEIADYHPADVAELTMGEAIPAAAEHGLWRGESKLLHADGTEVPVSQVLIGHRDATGELTHYSTVMRDLRPLRTLEQQLSQRQRLEAVGRLAGGVAHDFNNLLTVIQNAAQWVRDDLPADHEGKKDLEQVMLASERAADLCRQLLSFARKQIIEPKTVRLQSVVEQLMRLFRRTVGEDIMFHLDLPADLWPIRVDPSQLDQILVNLVVNARDAMPDGGQLTIEAVNVELDADYAESHPDVLPGDYVMIAVSDTGVGMTPEVQARAFEPFFSTKGPHRGSGLGLSTVHGAVRQNGAHLYLYSEVGKGTTLKIYWPRSVPDAETPRAPRARETVGQGTILVVEDEALVRQLTVRVLERAGFHVLSAPDGPKALELAEAHEGPIDVVVTDVVMPRMNGRELAQRLIERRPAIEVLFVSGYTENSIVHHGVLDEAVSFLSKPFTAPALVQSINRLLGRE